MSLDALANIGSGAAAAIPLLTSFLEDTSMMYRVIGSRASPQTGVACVVNVWPQKMQYWSDASG